MSMQSKPIRRTKGVRPYRKISGKVKKVVFLVEYYGISFSNLQIRNTDGRMISLNKIITNKKVGKE